MRLLGHAAFIVSYMLALTQYFEFSYRLWENQLLSHPVFSHMIVHHGYFGFLGIAIVYVCATKEDWMRLRRFIF